MSSSLSIGILILHVFLPGCASLKEKRSRIKSILARLHREFNISVSEVDHQDRWQEAILACAWVSNDATQTRRSLEKVVPFFETLWPDLPILEYHIELV